MNRREFIGSVSAALAGVSQTLRIAAQDRTTAPDLAAMAREARLTVVNRMATPLVDGARTGIRLSAAAGDGVALLPDIQLGDGTIELDIRGKDVPQQSFVGIAFHAVNGSTFDGVYFRPFNFRAATAESRGHAVQYHSPPEYTWDRLRREHPGEYEQPVDPVPDPTGWFRARIVLAGPTVRVFVADAATPSLAVRKLNSRTTGLVGLWVGNNSAGDFAHLSITPA